MDEGMMMIIGGSQSFEYMNRDKESRIDVSEILSDNDSKSNGGWRLCGRCLRHD
jgi:hypothetical protein